MSKPRTRANGEGSIYPRGEDKNGKDLGWAAYAWVTKPDGKMTRKYVYGPDREAVYPKWIELQKEALDGPVVTDPDSIAEYGEYWLEEIVKPNLSPGTYITYRGWFDRQIRPGLGSRKLDKRLRVRSAQEWFNRVAQTCQCCYQGKDTKRKPGKQRCCAVGDCCEDRYSRESLEGLRRALRAMFSCAIVDELVDKNVAALIKLPKKRKLGKGQRRKRRWSSEDARQFLESARADGDRFYSVYVNILVLGLRKGEALGIDESEVDFDAAELDLAWQLQRLGKDLVRRETKTATSDDVIPLPEICLAATRWRLEQKERDKRETGEAWQGSTLVMTTALGTPVEPRQFNREWDRRCDLAGVPRITPRDARRTCGSILADLDVHPRVAMQILRHAKFSITMEIYTEVSSESTREALKRLGKELGG